MLKGNGMASVEGSPHMTQLCWNALLGTADRWTEKQLDERVEVVEIWNLDGRLVASASV